MSIYYVVVPAITLTSQGTLDVHDYNVVNVALNQSMQEFAHK